MSTTRQSNSGRHQHLRALEPLVADRGGGGDAQAPIHVLCCVGMRGRLLDVFDGDEPHAALRVVDDHEFLDAMQMQEPAGLLVIHPFADRHHLAGHQFRHRLARIVGKAHVAIGENADELRGLAVRPTLDDGNAGDRSATHEGERVGERGVGEDGDRIDHHPALEPLDLAHLFRLIRGRQIAVDDADPACLGHGDRQSRLGDGVHRRGDDREVEPDRPSELSADIRRARHHRAEARTKQDVVERKSFGNRIGFNHRHRHAPLCGSKARIAQDLHPLHGAAA